MTHEERDFEDGEHKIRPLAEVGGRDCYVVQSLYSDHRARRRRPAGAPALPARCPA
ncbi:MAG: hypothetical protein U5L11_04745 [Arhodomonas sp.]|nr:hypothetical protein [Arhodomonas sp.]